jgi:hypothetical protein
VSTEKAGPRLRAKHRSSLYDMCLSPRGGSDPMVLGPCRIMSDVLPMPALGLTPESTSWIRINHLKVSHEQLLVSTSMSNQVWGRKSKTGGMAFKPSAIFSATQTATPSTQAFGQDLRPTANSGGPLRERFAGRALP